MTVLVTGGLGFIGSRVAEMFRDAGWDVIVVDNGSANVVNDIPGVSVLWGDVCEPWQEYLGRGMLDLIVHAASPVGSVGVLSREGRIIDEMVQAARRMCGLALAKDARLVFVSSSEVYGTVGVYHESDPCQVKAGYSARREYAIGKLAAEYLIGGHRLEPVIIRPFNVVGPRQSRAKGFVLPTFCEQALEGHPLTVFGDGHQRRAFTGVEDVAEFIVGQAPAAPAGIYNVGNPLNETTIIDLARMILAEVGRREDIVMTDGRSIHGPAYSEADGYIKLPATNKARALGWEPTRSLREIVRHAVETTLVDRAVGV